MVIEVPQKNRNWTIISQNLLTFSDSIFTLYGKSLLRVVSYHVPLTNLNLTNNANSIVIRMKSRRKNTMATNPVQNKINSVNTSTELQLFENYYNLASNHNITFAEHMQRLIAECGIKDKFEFQEKTKLSSRFYNDVQKNGYIPSMKTLVSICIGLDLDIGMANILLASLARSFKIDSRRDYAYQYILQYHSGFGIESANAILKELGFDGDDLLGSRDNA